MSNKRAQPPATRAAKRHKATHPQQPPPPPSHVARHGREGGEGGEGGEEGLLEDEFVPQCDHCREPLDCDEGCEAKFPTTVGCFHTLCRRCVGGTPPAVGGAPTPADPRASPVAVCPVCNKEGVARPREDVVWGLREARAREEEAEVGAQGSGEGEVERKDCELCREPHHAAAFHCRECNQAMCEFMQSCHRRHRDTSAHTLRPLGCRHAAPNPEPATCARHGQQLALFCATDNAMVCAECVVDGHKGHELLRPRDGARAWLLRLASEGAERLAVVERAVPSLAKSRDDAQVVSAALINEIDEVFKQIEERRQALVDGPARACKAISRQLLDARTVVRSLRVGLRYVEDALAQDGDHCLDLLVQRGGQLKQFIEASRGVDTAPRQLQGEFVYSRSRLQEWLRNCHVGTEREDEWEASPTTSSVVSTASEAFSRHASVVTSTGKVLMLGGINGNRVPVNYSYDAERGWVSLLPMPTTRSGCGACVVGNVVVVVGGRQDGQSTDRAEVYDVNANSWRTLPPRLNAALRGCGVVACGGRVFVVGGQENSEETNTVWSLDVELQQQQQQQQQPQQQRRGQRDDEDGAAGGALSQPRWEQLAPMSTARAFFGCAAAHDLVFACGGSTTGQHSTNEVEAYDVATGRWSPLPNMPHSRAFCAACCGGGNVFVVGGEIDKPLRARDRGSVLAYSVHNRTWALVGNLATARSACSAVCIGRCVLVFGGKRFPGDGDVFDVEMLEF